jgi:hypothetical protein
LPFCASEILPENTTSALANACAGVDKEHTQAKASLAVTFNGDFNFFDRQQHTQVLRAERN